MVKRPGEILIVDDEANVRELLEGYFRAKGYAVGLASDGRAAITALERDPARFHLVVTDLQMPGANGIEVLRAAKQFCPSASVVIVTGYGSLDSAIQAVRLGACDYLTKPFSLSQIDVILERIEERRAIEAENRTLLEQSVPVQAPERAPILDRLDALDARLTRAEELLREILRRVSA